MYRNLPPPFFCFDILLSLQKKDSEILDTKRIHAQQKRDKNLELLDIIRVRTNGLHSVFLSLMSRTDNTQEGYNALQKKACSILLFSQVHFFMIFIF